MTNLLHAILPAQTDGAPSYGLWFDSSGASYTAAESDSMYMWLWWFCIFWFVGLMGLLVMFVVRYRRRRGVPAEKSPSHNTTLEIAWTIIPSLFLVYIFFRGFHGWMDQQVGESGGIDINVAASQWNWGFTYANGVSPTEFTTDLGPGDTSSPILLVPEDTPVNLIMSSQDVIHSFWVPDFRYKRDVFPNRYTNFSFRTLPLDPEDGRTKTGTYTVIDLEGNEEEIEFIYRDHWVFCAEYCGDLHADMAALVRVVPRHRFDAFLENPFKPGTPLDEIGESLYKSKGCASCHSVDGSSNVGPTWKDMYGASHQYTDGSSIVMDENHVRESILVPAAHIREGYANQMPSYQGQLRPDQIDAMIAYMKALSPGGEQ